MKNASMIIFYGHPGFLDIANPELLVDFFNYCQCDCVAVFDKVNVEKDYIKKYCRLTD